MADENADSVEALVDDSSPGNTKIDQAVQHLNDLYLTRSLEMYLETGKFVIDNFFDGTPPEPGEASKNTSFRVLSRREDLHMRGSTLSDAVRLVREIEVIPKQVRASLSFSHHRKLLAVREEPLRVELAEAAVEHGWSKAKLAEKIKDAQPPSSRGRPRLPRIVKTVNRLKSVVASDAFTVTDDVSQAQRAEIRRNLEEVRQRCLVLEAALADDPVDLPPEPEAS